jgi:predicted amidohydrolase
MDTVGRPVHVSSLCFPPELADSALDAVRAAVREKPDLILLPETWQGTNPLPMEHAVFEQLRGIAREHRTYILHPFFFDDGHGRVYNSAFLIDRKGDVAGRYDKAYPYWAEMDMNPPVTPGSGACVFDCDFGKLGIAICFDANFPNVFEGLARDGAELIAWVSAYSAGDQLRAHVLNHHIPLVTATYPGHCMAFDCAGRRVYDERSPGVSVHPVTLDLDECVFHENFNMEGRQRLLSQIPQRVRQVVYLQDEQWFVMRAMLPGVSAREVCREAGMEELPAYKRRSRKEIDMRRNQARQSLDNI